MISSNFSQCNQSWFQQLGKFSGSCCKLWSPYICGDETQVDVIPSVGSFYRVEDKSSFLLLRCNQEEEFSFKIFRAVEDDFGSHPFLFFSGEFHHFCMLQYFCHNVK